MGDAPPQNGVTYQTYKSKRASQHVRASSFTNAPPPPAPADDAPRRPLSMVGALPVMTTVSSSSSSPPSPEASSPAPQDVQDVLDTAPLPSTPVKAVSVPPVTIITPPPPPPAPAQPSSPAPSTSSLPPSPTTSTVSAPAPRPTSTFRRLPAKSSAPHTPSLLSPARALRTVSGPQPPSPLHLPVALDGSAPSSPALRPDSSLSTRPSVSPAPATNGLFEPPVPSPSSSRIASPNPAPPAVLYHKRPPTVSPGSSTSSARPAPYRPGFQPKGVYRPRTDEFIAARSAVRDAGRIEQQRLERRLDKLIDLHFASGSRPKPPSNARRASSFFELDITATSPSELLRGVLSDQRKNDVREAEQTITPWEDDGAVPACRLCAASFHPITNRKHHCRLCGKIICALPPKVPQRPQTCSLLFVADPRTSAIEEVGEGVDYGVKKRGVQQDKKSKADEDKFLKGVRICRECRPILLRKQYMTEQAALPTFARLHQAMLHVEKELEDSLPAFQEMLIALNTNNPESQNSEAKTTHKRLLDAFADYDTLAKRIISLPCAPGSSQERVQAAIRTRANLFLQQHMVPLQALPRPASRSKTCTKIKEGSDVDVDAQLAMTLQPLLEQEKLLESMIEEARARRKFEDARTLQSSLEEIRAEIDRILDGGQVVRSGD